jgi:hypothetical protein
MNKTLIEESSRREFIDFKAFEVFHAQIWSGLPDGKFWKALE